MKPWSGLATAALLAVAASANFPAAQAATKYFAYNMTSTTDFPGVYMAPAGTGHWGPNQALNDDDKALNITERLTLTGLRPGLYDVKLVDKKGRTCIKHGADLTHERSFEIHDADVKNCS